MNQELETIHNLIDRLETNLTKAIAKLAKINGAFENQITRCHEHFHLLEKLTDQVSKNTAKIDLLDAAGKREEQSTEHSKRKIWEVVRYAIYLTLGIIAAKISDLFFT